MTRFRTSVLGTACFAATIIAGLTMTPSLNAQNHSAAGFAGNKIIPLIRMDLTGVPNRQVIANIYEVPAGAMVPRHFHHGDEFHYVLSGEWAAEVEGKPDRTLKPGDAQYVEREKWHGGRVVSPGPMKLLGIMIVDKDKPVTELKH